MFTSRLPQNLYALPGQARLSRPMRPSPPVAGRPGALAGGMLVVVGTSQVSVEFAQGDTDPDPSHALHNVYADQR
jgi:hypothetical protein